MFIPTRSIVQLAIACVLWMGLTSHVVKAAEDVAPKPEATLAEEAGETVIPEVKHDESPAKDDHNHSEAEGDHSPEEPHSTGGDENEDHEEEGGSGMEFKRDLALWSLVTFLVFVFVLRAFAWGPLVDGLDNRESHFRSQLAEAEAARQQAQRMLQEHAAKLESVQDEVKAIIEQAGFRVET